MTARTKVHLLLAALACANLAIWGGRQLMAGLFDPILRAVGA